jgi:hypothetical protein
MRPGDIVQSASAVSRSFWIIRPKHLSASGNLGAEQVAKTVRPDGYTFLFASISLATSVSLTKLNFNPRKDLAPVDAVSRLERAVLYALQTDAVKEGLAFASAESIAPSRVEFGKYFNSNVERWARLVREGKIAPLQ